MCGGLQGSVLKRPLQTVRTYTAIRALGEKKTARIAFACGQLIEGIMRGL